MLGLHALLGSFTLFAAPAYLVDRSDTAAAGTAARCPLNAQTILHRLVGILLVVVVAGCAPTAAPPVSSAVTPTTIAPPPKSTSSATLPVATVITQDSLAQRDAFLNSDQVPDHVLDVTTRALEAMRPRAGEAQHLVVEREVRVHPQVARLRDPYHFKPDDSFVTESWAHYGPDGTVARRRLDNHGSSFSAASVPRRVTWTNGPWGKVYDARANRVFTYSRVFRWSDPAQEFLAVIDDVFRYRQYDLEQHGDAVTLSSTVPITDTPLGFAERTQSWIRSYGEVTFLSTMPLTDTEPGIAEWEPSGLRTRLGLAEWEPSGLRSFGGSGPWLGDLDPVSVTFRTTFDVTTARLDAVEIVANGPFGSTPVQRTTVHTWDHAAPATWDYTPPDDAVVMDGEAPDDQRLHNTDLLQALKAARSPMWGFAQTMMVKHPTLPLRKGPPSPWAEFHRAVENGAAITLSYKRGANHISLTQGPAGMLRPILENTLPRWEWSEQREMLVAGKQRPVWVMKGDSRRAPDDKSVAWAVVELGETLLVMRHDCCAKDREAIWREINFLVRLHADYCAIEGAMMQCRPVPEPKE
ncbi:MAG: hypothetical protein AVDCRST_MAG93-6284 [uncultured Chloroflexia bacterium]|uniref:Uncharacterized protein n=1 Tax=uncultured Chloroflexia bacterium TaxID=1672391 RepID=A0A6J4LHF0_9CHLR|nr:MAG: hypothetical protein AVDCRST_MAG93-6284 [uncultured Chloroflexia bacterium]